MAGNSPPPWEERVPGTVLGPGVYGLVTRALPGKGPVGSPALIKDLATLLSTFPLPCKLSRLSGPRLHTWLVGAEIRKREAEKLGLVHKALRGEGSAGPPGQINDSTGNVMTS